MGTFPENELHSCQNFNDTIDHNYYTFVAVRQTFIVFLYADLLLALVKAHASISAYRLKSNVGQNCQHCISMPWKAALFLSNSIHDSIYKVAPFN